MTEIALADLNSFAFKAEQPQESPTEDSILVTSGQQVQILKQVIHYLETDINARLDVLEADMRKRRQGEQPASQPPIDIDTSAIMQRLEERRVDGCSKVTRDKTKLILDIVHEVSKEVQGFAPLEIVLDIAVGMGLEYSRAEEIVTRLRRDGSLMMPKHNRLGLV
jgi:predicted transcriptional regulator